MTVKRDYSPEQRAAYARCLRAAKDHLWNGDGAFRSNVEERRFICQALVLAWMCSDVSQAEAAMTILEVRARLGGYNNLEDWLCRNSNMWPQDEQTMQGLRFVWIDSMIEEFER